MAITITPNGGTPVVFADAAIVPGTLTFGGGDDDRGGDNDRVTRAGIANDGSFEAIIDGAATLTEALLSPLQSGVGEGDVDITGDATSYDALVDLEYFDDSVQKVRVTWKGTTTP
ncbi:MAG: hypothetical protein GY851_35740 [bacterium]|nr:hypothetical protein [bacterium]